MKLITRGAAAPILVAALLSACGGGETPPALSVKPLSADLKSLALDGPIALAARLRKASGPVDIWVTLDLPGLARARIQLAEGTPGMARIQSAGRETSAVRSAMAARLQAIKAQQAGMAMRLSALGAKELGRATIAINAIAVTVDASQIAQIAAMPGVKSVRPVRHHELHLSESVPYVGAAAAQAGGVDGSGVRVAVLDSGIDYTHRNLGGAGTPAAYEAAYGTGPSDPRNTSRDGLFPTAKVVEGFDFVGDAWPNGPRTEDADPIDFQGHGTHVADIIAGRSADGTHKGVAPGASLLAVRVCSAIATSCNGVALIKAMDYALDPNGDGDLSDAVDVINLSLGSSYGQLEDDLTLAVENAVGLGAVVVASAGNSADRPAIVGSPSIAPGAISVAQTQMPGATAVGLQTLAPASIAGTDYNTATLDWAPIGPGLSGQVVYVGRGCTGDPQLAAPAGKVALVDRGVCAVSQKVANMAAAGATGVLVGLIAAGDAVSFSLGDGSGFVPSLVITQARSVAIKNQLGAGEAVGVALAPPLSLRGSMVSSSSRGPSFDLGSIKPEIGAPGASVSAIAGGGSAQSPFGGTSGAAPMVAGAAALLLQAQPARSPLQVKAMLMNSAETQIYTNPALRPGQRAPVSRIGAGELRVNKALALSSAAWDMAAKSAALSFGVVEADRQLTLKRTLSVQNFSNSAKQFSVSHSFRDSAQDQASGAVRVLASSSSVSVPANGQATLDVTLVIDPTKLPEWNLNGGALGGNGALLDLPEYDGYLSLVAGAERLSVPWHVLPRKAARTQSLAYTPSRTGANKLQLSNTGATAGAYDVFSLLGSSAPLPAGTLPGMGDNFAVADLYAFGARYIPDAGTPLLQLAVSSYGRLAHPAYPIAAEVEIDSNVDGVPDWLVYTMETGTTFGSGQTVVAVASISTGTTTAYFYCDCDLNSSSRILTLPLAAIGASPGQTLGLSARVYDNYFTGNYTDQIAGKRFTPGASRFSSNSLSGSVPRGSGQLLEFSNVSQPDAKSTETGLLLMFRRNSASEAQGLPIPLATPAP